MARPTFFQRVKYEKESKGDLAAEGVATPGGEKIFSCLQCGTCGSACPVSVHMDSTPQAYRASRGDLSPPLSSTGPGESVGGDAQTHGPQYARTKGEGALDHGSHIGSGLLHAWFCTPLPALASCGLWRPGSGAPRTTGLELLSIISL
jgi:ferredoxin